MATPHLAGSAAVVRQQHPMWTAAQVRSAVVNTADQGVLKNFKSGVLETDVNVTGTGRENLLSAVNSKVAVDPVSVSFGAVPSGSGQTLAYNVTLTNLGSGNASYSLSVGSGSGGVAYSVSPSSITIPAGGSASATVTMAASKGASFGGHSATVSVKSGANEVAHAVVYTFVK
jgi:subtilisin family serine protease